MFARTGTLWEGRYTSTIVEAECYLLTVYRYIELNPVRGNMVDHTNESRGQVTVIQNNYCSLSKGMMSVKDIDDIRECTNKAWVLGHDRFKVQIELQQKRLQ